MTYAKLDTYRSMAGVEGEFTRYMEAIERSYINLTADKIYDRVTFKKEPSPQTPKVDESKKNEQPNPNPVEEKPKGKSNGRLSLNLLVNSKARESNVKEYAETTQLLKSLIQTLYGSQKQFQQLLQMRPTLIDELIDQIPRAVDALPQNIKIKKAEDLSNLELGEGLDEPFYLMLKGCPAIKKPVKLQQVSDTSDDRADDAEEAEEFTSDKSYDSLLNFVDLHTSLRINIFIASKPLLLAIYGDPVTVENILQKRFELFKSVAHKEMNDAEASEKLKNEFQLRGEGNLLDYKVTGSDPRRYN